MTEAQAKYLAASFTDADYQAKKIRGRWVVWSVAAEHEVEFDQKTLDAAANYVFNARIWGARKETTMRKTTREGWEIIKSVETQIWRDELDRPKFGIVWIVTVAGDVFQRSIKVGEIEESVAAYYRKRGCTDNDCTFYNEGIIDTNR